MKKKGILLIFLLGLVSIQVSGKWFQQKTIYSKALQQEKTYYVGLPKDYNELDLNTKYPVILFLHSASVTATEIVNSLEPFLDNFLTKPMFDKLFKVIFIIPDGSCEPYKGSFYTNSALYGNYEDYIAQDMMEEVSNNYHTFPAREKWSIIGHSMGGYGAMKIALKYPGKFIGVSSLSGPLNITYFDEMLPVLQAEHGAAAPYDFCYEGSLTKLIYSMAGAFSPIPGASNPVRFPVTAEGSLDPPILALWENHNPINLIRPWRGNPAMAIHTYCGELDEFKLMVPNRMFCDSLDKYHISHTYKQDPYGDHVNSLFTSLPQGINFLYNVMDTAQIRVQTEIEDKGAFNPIAVYPNPASERFYLSGLVKDIKALAIYNLTGQKVMQIENLATRKVFDISLLDKGMYFISLQGNKGNITTLRFVKR